MMIKLTRKDRARIKYNRYNILGTFVDSSFHLLHQRFDPRSIGAEFTIKQCKRVIEGTNDFLPSHTATEI